MEFKKPNTRYNEEVKRKSRGNRCNRTSGSSPKMQYFPGLENFIKIFGWFVKAGIMKRTMWVPLQRDVYFGKDNHQITAVGKDLQGHEIQRV